MTNTDPVDPGTSDSGSAGSYPGDPGPLGADPANDSPASNGGPANKATENFSESLHESISEITGNAQSAGNLLAGITQDISKLVRLEIELAKQEVVELARPKLLALGMGVLGLVLALFIVPFMLLTVFEVFDTFMPRWLAALVVTLLIAGASGGIFLFAKSKLEGTFVPEKTVSSVKITLKTLKESVKWAKRPTR